MKNVADGRIGTFFSNKVGKVAQFICEKQADIAIAKFNPITSDALYARKYIMTSKPETEPG
jgi:hypothetical protein